MKITLVFFMFLVTATDTSTTEQPTACGDTSYYGPSGVISSPNYPYSYNDYLDCNYTIYASSGSSLSLFFKSFSTEQCCDFVTISCPNNASFPSQRLSGYSLPQPVSIPWCSKGLIQFHTDYSIVYNGFSLEYYVSDGGCGETIYRGSFGYMTSPDYPSYYGYNQNCSNIIWAPQQSSFYIVYLQFELEELVNNSYCRDWLEINCLDNTENGPDRYCGIITGYSRYVWRCHRVLLWFHSDGFNNYQGFYIQYEIYPDSVTDYTTETRHSSTAHPTKGTSPGTSSSHYTGTAYPPTVTTDPVCGDSSYFDSYGVLSSPNYPGDYYNNLNCDYYVQASTGSSLSFVFNSLHVETSDIVTISCPPNSNFLPQEFSGHILPDPVSMPVCSQGRVNFRTDYTNVSNGFSIDYYVNSAGCGNTIYLGSNGHVNSPFWPDSYGYNQNCSNIIWATEQSTIHLNFLSFNLQDNCSCDWLEVSCLDNLEFSPYKFCGNYNSYELYIYRCSQVLLWFHSDGFYNYPGFIIEYTVYPVEACGVTSYNDPSGVISSPNYPGNYSNFLYCDYTIYSSTPSDLTMIFTAFEVQQDFDFVTISCAANSSYPKYELTGNYGNRPPGPFWISDCSQVSVNFHTDHSTVDSGFSLEYYVSEGGCGTTLYYGYDGYVTSPNWPDNYGYNQNCSNIIYVWGKSTFYLIFHSFTLQSCCNCDWLEISCLDNSDYVPTRYCESNAPANASIEDCSQVLLWFHSDGSNNDQGFNIEYNVSLNSNADKVPESGKPKTAEDIARKGKLNPEKRRMWK